MLVVSNIEAIQSQLKNIYTNTLSTLCPLPWLEEAEDVQYNFDDVFIPLRTIDIKIQQKTGDKSGPSGSRDDKEQSGDLSGPSGSRDDKEQSGDLSGPSGSRDDKEQSGDLSGPSGETGLHHQTRYTYDDVILLYIHYI